MVPWAHGRHRVDDARVVLCSRNARSRNTLVGRAQLDHCGRRPLTLKKMECGLGILLCIQRDIETGLHQCEAEQFALAWAVFDQQNGGMRHHYRGRHQQGMCQARR